MHFLVASIKNQSSCGEYLGALNCARQLNTVKAIVYRDSRACILFHNASFSEKRERERRTSCEFEQNGRERKRERELLNETRQSRAKGNEVSELLNEKKKKDVISSEKRGEKRRRSSLDYI